MKNNTKTKQATTTKSATAVTADASLTLVSPKGKQHSIAASKLRNFATRYNLDVSNLRKVISGSRLQHKGWTAAAYAA